MAFKIFVSPALRPKCDFPNTLDNRHSISNLLYLYIWSVLSGFILNSL